MDLNIDGLEEGFEPLDQLNVECGYHSPGLLTVNHLDVFATPLKEKSLSPYPNLLLGHVKPVDFAAHLEVSERTLKKVARELNAFHIIGRTMFFTIEDIANIMDGTKPCHTKSTNAAKSGTTAVQLPAGDYAALAARLKKPSLKELPRKQKAVPGKVISMDRART
jgi:hypothetical protein